MTEYTFHAQVTTPELQPGDKVRLPGRVVRTVESVAPASWQDPSEYVVTYAEGRTDEWSAANIGNDATLWEVVK